MPGSSYNGSWYYLDDDAFEADYPVSTAYSWLCRDNIAHLIDSCGQYRISWKGKAGRQDRAVGVGTLYWAMPFPLTMLSPDGLTGLYTKITYARSSGADSCALTARYVWDGEPLFSDRAYTLHSFTDTTSSTTGEVFDNTKLGVATKYTGLGRKLYNIEEGSDDHMTALYMARLEIQIDVVSSSESAYLLGVQVIEFPVWWGQV